MNFNIETNGCDPAQMDSFLNRELNAAEEDQFTAHLNNCPNCRVVLEQKAAEPADWTEAERLLKPSPFDEPSGEPRSQRQPPQIQAVLEALSPTDDPHMLGRLGGYEVSGVIGSGGMGVVLKAHDPALDRTIAIKVLSPHLAASGAARKRFAREAKAAAAVLHPNVIAIHSVPNDGPLPYLVMPYLRGSSLQKRLDEEGPLALHEILRIGSQIAAGLAAAHAQGLVHRDIKPANILLEEGIERVTITDFGLARAVDDATITRSGVIAGTPQFMSPEQARGEAVDHRSDLFSLGALLYTLCTGRPPFRAETPYGVICRINDEEPRLIRETNPDVPEWLCTLIARLMSKRPADRFDSAQEVAELLEDCLAHVQQPAVMPLPACLKPGTKRSPSSQSTQTIKRKGVLAMIGTVSLALLGMVCWQATHPPDIAGTWSSENWGKVALKQTEEGEYKGTYSQAAGEQPGALALNWSRIERRFNGTWNEGKQGKARFGEISLRLVDGKIRGAYTTDRGSKINPATPRLADLLWVKGGARQQPSVPSKERSAAPKPSVENTEAEEDRLWNVYGVTPKPVSDTTAKVLEYIGLHLSPVTKSSFREKNVFADYAGGLEVRFFRNGGPAHKAGFVSGPAIVVKLQGQTTLTLDDLDAAMKLALEQIKTGEANALHFDVLISGKTLQHDVPVPVEQLDSQTSDSGDDVTSTITPAGSPTTRQQQKAAQVELTSADLEPPFAKPFRGQEKATARLILVFADDRSRRAVPSILIDVGGRTIGVTVATASIVPTGTAHAIDRTYIEVPREAPIPVEYDPQSTPELFIHSGKLLHNAARLEKLDSITLEKSPSVHAGDTIYALDIFEPVGLSRTKTRVVALDRQAELKIPDTDITHEYDGLIQIDKTFREGTPLYKDGKFAGLILLGHRFLGEDANKSYVVPAERIAELIEDIERDALEATKATKLPHEVPFEIGASNLRDGDRITIKQVRGTDKTIQPGQTYEIQGTYKLASHNKAKLAAFVTAMNSEGKSHARDSQTMTIERGEGTFSLRLKVPYKGKPHISFYSLFDGEGFGGVYFGTGDSVLKHGWWEDSPKSPKPGVGKN